MTYFGWKIGMNGGVNIISSGARGACLSAMGLFGSGLIHLGAAATVSTLGTAAVVGLVGGLVMYPAAIALRTLLYAYGLLNLSYRRLVFSIDLLTASLALPVGAWMLGLAVYPFFCAALVAASLFVLFKLISEAVQYLLSNLQSRSNSQSQLISTFFSKKMFDTTSLREENQHNIGFITAAIGSY
jgi:hypothetical protein